MVLSVTFIRHKGRENVTFLIFDWQSGNRAYDFRGLLIQVALDAGGSAQRTSYQYDETGNLVAQTDANNHTTRFDYDALGRRVKRVLPENQSETFGYDLAGNLVQHTNFNGIVITNQFDLANRMTNQVTINGYQVTWAYDQIGLRTNMTDPSGVTTLAYNELRQLTNKTVTWSGGPAVSLGYGYDAAGAVTNIWSSTANGVNLVYEHDPLGRITNVLANGAAAAGYGFDKAGNLESVRYGNGVTNLCQYDPRNRLTSLVWGLGANSARFAYQLGPTGIRATLAESFAAPPYGISRGYAWSYDRLYRLTQEVLSGDTVGTVAYGFDPVGNRTDRVSTLGQLPSTSSSYTANDRLVGHGYDASGNTTTASANFYQYDPLDRLTNVNNGAVLLWYDGDGNRVRKTVGGVTTYYLVDDRNPSGYAQVLEEWTASGGTTNLSRVYNYGLALASQRESIGTIYYFVTDGQGSTRVLIDGAGTVFNVFAYDAYGTLIASNAPPQTTYLYTGQQWDPDLGMYYLRARYFNPQIGCMWTQDDGDHTYQEEPKSLHLYGYAEGDPVNNTDPSGREIEGMLGVMDIGFTLAVMRSPATSTRSVGLPSDWLKSRPFTDAELALAETIYHGHINYAHSGVNYGKWWFLQQKGREMTPGGIIYTGGETISDYTVSGAKPSELNFSRQKGTLIHELCHVWQYQQGMHVMANGAFDRNYDFYPRRHPGLQSPHASDQDDYIGPNFGKIPFQDYGVEQQAQMVEVYYYAKNHLLIRPQDWPSVSEFEKIIPFSHK